MIDYKKTAIELINKGDWSNVIKMANELLILATEAKYNNEPESFCGMKKGHFNVFIGGAYDSNFIDILEESLKKAGFQVFNFWTVNDINKSIKNGTFNIDLLDDSFTIITTRKKGVYDKIIGLNYPTILYDLDCRSTQDNYYSGLEKDKIRYILKNRKTGDKYEFGYSAIIGLLRENRIDKILN